MVVEGMNVNVLLGFPEELKVISGEVSKKVMTITAVSTQTAPCCPCCGTRASRTHSHYSRQLTDLPCAGQRVRLILHVRKFFCDEKTCARKIFTKPNFPCCASEFSMLSEVKGEGIRVTNKNSIV